MPGIAPQAPPAALVVGSVQVDAPGRDLARAADQRERAGGAEVERAAAPRAPTRRSSRASGASRRPVRAQRRPQRRTIRRWIAAARTNSISCSVIAQASASNGSGRRRDAHPRPGAHGRADQRIVAEALVEGAQVVVDAQREPHPLDRQARGRLVGSLSAEKHALGARLRHAHHGRPAVDVQQPLPYASSPPREAVRGAPHGHPEHPSGDHLRAHVDHEARTLRRPSDELTHFRLAAVYAKCDGG